MSIDWFRKPTRGEPGTLNACYNALDRHVIRGQAEAVSVEIDGRKWTYADLLAEVGAFAGALRAFGVGPGEAVLVGRLPGHHEVVASLAVARVGAVRWYVDVKSIVDGTHPRVAVLPTKVDVDLGETPVITVDDSTELSWATVMRAGRTDPAGCAELPMGSLLAVVDGEAIAIINALEGQPPVPDGAKPIDVGGLAMWVWE